MSLSTWAAVAARAASVVLLLASVSVAADKRVVTDSAGRRVEVPARIERVYAAGGPASVLLYVLAPDKLLGWTRPPSAEERAYLPAPYAELPTLGRLTGRGNTANVEVVLGARPDIILDYGSITPTYVSLADRIQQQTGIPYLLFDGSLSAIPGAFKAVGDLLGVGDRAAELGRYAERVLAETDRRVAAIPGDKRPLVYYARGPRGLDRSHGLDQRGEPRSPRRAQCDRRADRGGTRRGVSRTSTGLEPPGDDHDRRRLRRRCGLGCALARGPGGAGRAGRRSHHAFRTSQLHITQGARLLRHFTPLGVFI